MRHVRYLGLLVLLLSEPLRCEAQPSSAGGRGQARVVRVTGGAADAVDAAVETRPRFQRVRPVLAERLPEFQGMSPSGSFTLSPTHMVEADRGRLELWSASVYPDEPGGWAQMRGGLTDGHSHVRFSIHALQGRTYVLDIVAHRLCGSDPCAPEQFTIVTPAGRQSVPIDDDDPHAIVGYTPTQTGWYTFRVEFEDTRLWIFRSVKVTVLQ